MPEINLDMELVEKIYNDLKSELNHKHKNLSGLAKLIFNISLWDAVITGATAWEVKKSEGKQKPSIRKTVNDSDGTQNNNVEVVKQ